jgi:hypothetical protein
VSHNSVLVDHETDSAWNNSKGLLDTVRFSDGSVRIAEEYEGEFVFRRECSMRLLIIVTYSYDFSTEVPEFLV